MSDISTDRLEPAGRVSETQRQDPRREPGSQARRRPRPTAPHEPETAENSEAETHQVDERV